MDTQFIIVLWSYSRSRRTCGLIQSNFTTIYKNIYTNINKKNSKTSAKHVCHILGRKISVDIGKKSTKWNNIGV